MSRWFRPDRPPAETPVTPGSPVAHVYLADRAENSTFSTNAIALIGMGLGYLAIAFFTVGTRRNLPDEVVAAAPLPLLLLIGGCVYYFSLQAVRAVAIRRAEGLLLQGTIPEGTETSYGFRALDATPFAWALNRLSIALIVLTWLLAAGFTGYCFARLITNHAPTALIIVAGCVHVAGLAMSGVPLVWFNVKIPPWRAG